MTDLEEFLPQINPKAPGCPLPTARQAIIQAARDLCERSRLWRHSAEIVVNDLDDLYFNVPDGSVVIDFESVLFDGQKLEPKTTDWMDRCMRGWRKGSIPGYPRFYSQIREGTLRVAPIENGLLTVNCVMKPTMDADQLPDFIYQQYAEAIAWGALARILATPEQPFTNYELAAAYSADFERKLASLSFKSSSGQQRARIRTKANYM